MHDLISRQWLMECINEGWIKFDTEKDANIYIHLVRDIAPSAQPEPLTDEEQRIFLAAMKREEKICEAVNRNFIREPSKVDLMNICREIKRKVKGALWT